MIAFRNRAVFTSLLCMICVSNLQLLLSGCAKDAVKEEFKSLMDVPGTANGSELMLALCGWPATAGMRPDSLAVELAPDSGRKDGRGIAGISAAGDSFSCKAKIAFTYSSTYAGGHGYGGGTEIKLGGFKKLDRVEPGISDPPGALSMKIDQTIKGRLDEKGVRLPDGSFAHHYSIDLDNANPLIRFNLDADRGLNPGGYVYQDGKLIDTFSCRWSGTQPYDNICPLEKGKAVILITAGRKTGSYSIRLDEPEDSARAMLRLPERYKKKSP